MKWSVFLFVVVADVVVVVVVVAADAVAVDVDVVVIHLFHRCPCPRDVQEVAGVPLIQTWSARRCSSGSA